MSKAEELLKHLYFQFTDTSFAGKNYKEFKRRTLSNELVKDIENYLNRKYKLVAGSEWVCEVDNKAQEFGNYKPHVENLKKGLIVEVFNVNGLIIFGHNQSMESWVVGEEQFLACFSPVEKENV